MECVGAFTGVATERKTGLKAKRSLPWAAVYYRLATKRSERVLKRRLEAEVRTVVDGSSLLCKAWG